MRKTLSEPALLTMTRDAFDKGLITDRRQKSKCDFTLTNTMMCAVAMFQLKYPALLQFDSNSRSENEATKLNLKTLYGVDKAPSDSQMRAILDPINQSEMRGAFNAVFAELQHSKVLQKIKYEGFYLISLDGTGYFSSNDIYCESCCVKEHRDGTVTYYHQALGGVIINPDYKEVFPLCPEPIILQDGTNKNDCERNAAKRFLEKLKKEHPNWSVIITEDSLASNAPHIELLNKLNFRFILESCFPFTSTKSHA